MRKKIFWRNERDLGGKNPAYHHNIIKHTICCNIYSIIHFAQSI